MGHRETIARQANDFRIWRAGSSVDWDCTATEIASDLGLHSTTVGDACARRGWPILKRKHVGFTNRHATDTLINSPYIAVRHE